MHVHGTFSKNRTLERAFHRTKDVIGGFLCWHILRLAVPVRHGVGDRQPGEFDSETLQSARLTAKPFSQLKLPAPLSGEPMENTCERKWTATAVEALPSLKGKGDRLSGGRVST